MAESIPVYDIMADNSDISEKNYELPQINSNSSVITHPKMIQIKGYEIPTVDPVKQFQKLWENLGVAVTKILYEKDLELQYEQLYHHVDELCRLNQQEKMFNELKITLEHYFSTKTAELQADYNIQKHLKNFDPFWRHFHHKINLISKIFTTLDRGFFLHDNPTDSLVTLSFSIFSKCLSSNMPLVNSIVDYVLMLIEDIRNGKNYDIEHISTFSRMLIEVQLYNKHFETIFIEKTKIYYSKESQRNISLPISEFLKHVVSRINLEENVISSLISQSSLYLLKLNQTVKWESFGRHFSVNLKKGFFKLLDDLQEDDLKLVYFLALQVRNGEETLTSNLCSYIKTRVNDMMGQPSTQLDYQAIIIKNMMIFFSNVVHNILPWFNDAANICKQAQLSFTNVFNIKPVKFCEYLAKFIDFEMRRIDNINDEYFNEFIPTFIDFLKSIHNKENFLLKYKILLADRLLDQKCSSIECEKRLLDKIKEEIGTEFTSKIDGMFRDIYGSHELSLRFNKTQLTRALESSLLILSQGFWPTYEFSKFNLPSCGTKELDVNFLEALILDLFNKKISYSVAEIAELINLTSSSDEIELHSAIQTLACGNYIILIKEPTGLKVSPTDKLTFNIEFHHEAFRIKVPRFSSPDQSIDLNKLVQPEYFDRELQIDSLVVNLLKKNKSLPKTELYDLILSKTKLPVTNIESLWYSMIQTMLNGSRINIKETIVQPRNRDTRYLTCNERKPKHVVSYFISQILHIKQLNRTS
ncbi:hypothetical protein HZS_5415, partial [Henneguya salminicola]